MVKTPDSQTGKSRAREASPAAADGGAHLSQAPESVRGSRRRLTMARIALSGALLVVAMGLGVAAWRMGASGAAAQSHAVQSSGQADIGGPFHLMDQNGRPVDQSVLKGKWSAVFFGYTYCPDTCPATLQALAAAQSRLTTAQRKDFQVVFVSVDPARDTPAQMKLYLSSQAFPQGALGLTGTPAEVAQVAKEYRAFYAKEGSGPDYAIQHSAMVYLMDPKGQFSEPLNETQPPDLLANQIKTVMAA